MGRKEKTVPSEMSESSPLGTRMRLARQRKGISLTALSVLLEYSKPYLSSIETGRERPSSDLVKKYEQVLGLEAGTLTRILDDVKMGAEQQRIVLSENIEEQGEQEIKEDRGEAPIVAGFYGREQELADLRRWIVVDRCQMVVVLGLGGIGKTTLAASLVERNKDKFEYIFWRSLQNAPPVESILKSCVLFLSDHLHIDLPKDLNDQILLLIKYLRKHRCLIILDNIEAILGSGDRTGHYREGYEGYSKLIQLLGEAEHQSTLLLTSREKPAEIPRLEGKKLVVRSMNLTGLSDIEGQQILEDEGLKGTNDIWQEFIHLYRGNPLALKLAAEPIRELFQGDIAAFLKEKEAVVGDIDQLLDQQFSRLSETEQEIMYWLASEREAASLDDLREDIIHLVNKRELLEALKSLRRRSMIETDETATTARFYLQPVIMEYVTNTFVETVFNEIVREAIRLLARHVLIKAQARDYIRMSQERLILEPLAKRLLATLGKEHCEQKLKRLLAIQRHTSLQVPTYVAGNALNLLIQLGCDLRGYDFSFMTVWEAYLQGVTLPGINFSHSDLSRSVFTDTFGSVLSVALSPDGETLAAGTVNSEVRLWYAASGTPLHTCLGHTESVRSVAFSPDSKLLVSSSDDQTLRIWQAETGKVLKILKDHKGRAYAVAFSPDGKTIASGSEDRAVRLWDESTGQHLKTLRGHTDRIWSITFSLDGKVIASGSEDRTVRLWDVNTGKRIRTLRGHRDRVRSVAFSPDGNTIMSGSEDKTVRLWDVNTGECTRTLEGHTDWVRSVAFSPDGRIVASGSHDRMIRLWDVSTGQCIKTLHEHRNWVRAVVFSRDGKTLVSGGDDQSVRLWDVNTGRCIKTLQGDSNWVRSVVFSPDGRTIASGGEDQTLRLWDVSTGRCDRIMREHSNRVRCVAFSPDGKIVASGSEDRTVRLWNTSTGMCRETFEGHSDWVRSVAFSPDGNFLASCSHDRTVRLWDVFTGQGLKLLEGHSDWVWSVAFSPDGTLLASGGDDETIRLWNAGSGLCDKILKEGGHQVKCLAFSPDGRIIASGGSDQVIRLWDAGTGQCSHTLKGHSDWIRSVAFRPDGLALASSSEDQTIYIWDISTSQRSHALKGHTSKVYSVTFSPDGKLLASGSGDGTIKLWESESGRLSTTLKSEGPYEGMKITGVRGLTAAQKAALKTLGAMDEDQQSEE